MWREANPWLERRLSPRLRAVALRVEATTVADIGSDHGYLPSYLLQTGRAERVIVVEKTQAPFQRARLALRRRAGADVRLGNGLSPLQPGEVDCLTMTGFGAYQMRTVLLEHPDRIPPRLVLQPNGTPEPLRQWARDHGYHLQQEEVVSGVYVVLCLQRLS